MHRYEELEKIYYKKKFLKIFFFIIGCFLIFALLYFVKKENKKSSPPKILKQIEKNTTKTKIKVVKKKEINKTIVKKQIQIKLKNTPKNVQEINQTLNFVVPSLNDIKITFEKNSLKTQKEKNFTKKVLNSKEVNKTQNIPKTIQIKEENANLTLLINRFNANQDYNLAIVIAKEYLKKNNIKEAKIWTLKANNLNPSDPQSWILFANILIKENKKNEALKLLKTYLDTYGNNDEIISKIRSLNE